MDGRGRNGVGGGGNNNSNEEEEEEEEEEEDDSTLWHRVEIDCDDCDESKRSWENLLVNVPSILRFIDAALDSSRELLIHDRTGVVTAPAIIIIHCMVKRRMRRLEATAFVKNIRREVNLSPSIVRGLTELEEALDRKKLDRLESRLRDASVFSMAF